MFLHESNQIRFREEQWRAGFPIHHLHRSGLKARPFLIQWDNLKGRRISLKLPPGLFALKAKRHVKGKAGQRAAPCSGGDPGSGPMGLARNELPEPTEQRLRLLWVSKVNPTALCGLCCSVRRGRISPKLAQ